MNFLKIDNFDTINGSGFGVVLWVAGCDIHCPGCHNQETWDPAAGQEWNYIEEEKLFNMLSSRHISRLTISGGHPLMPCNQQDVLELVQKVKRSFPHIKIWLYTGYVLEEEECKSLTVNKIFRNCDVVVDGPFIQNEYDKDLPFRGSRNQRVIDIQHYLDKKEIKELF